jgi:hypothetical protein
MSLPCQSPTVGGYRGLGNARPIYIGHRSICWVIAGARVGQRTRHSAVNSRPSECNARGNVIAPDRDAPEVEGAGPVDRKRIGTDNYGTHTLPYLTLDAW